MYLTNKLLVLELARQDFVYVGIRKETTSKIDRFIENHPEFKTRPEFLRHAVQHFLEEMKKK